MKHLVRTCTIPTSAALSTALLLANAAALSAATITGTQPSVTNDAPVSRTTPYSPVSLDPNQRVWQRTTTTTLPDGRTTVSTNSYTEIATGMAFKKVGVWTPSDPGIDPADGGAAATNAAHKAFFAVDANTLGALSLTTPEGTVIPSHVLCLSLLDTSTGSNTVIATLTNSIGQIIASNKVLYPNALQGECTADILYENRKAGLEQNIVLRTQIPSLAGMNPETTVIQVWTEFEGSANPQVSDGPASPSGIVDQRIAFGTMAMRPGTAFLVGGSPAASPRTRVFKQWVTDGSRRFLAEQVPLPAVSAQLQSLPPPAGASTNSPSSGGGRSAMLRRSSPLQCQPPIRLARKAPRQIQVAAARTEPSGYCIDYFITASQTNMTFKGDTTYLVNGNVVLIGKTTFEGNCVLKFAPADAGALIIGNGTTADSIDCQGSAFRPVVFSASDDDAVGEVISGSTGNPSGAYAYMAMDIYGPTNTWLGIFHRRMRARLGPAGANTATARKLACIIYHMLKYEEDYIDVDCLLYQEKIRKSRISKLSKQAEELGYELVKTRKILRFQNHLTNFPCTRLCVKYGFYPSNNHYRSIRTTA